MSVGRSGAYHRVLKLARTIADLAAEEQIATTHVAEALQYRPPRGRGLGRGTEAWPNFRHYYSSDKQSAATNGVHCRPLVG